MWLTGFSEGHPLVGAHCCGEAQGHPRTCQPQEIQKNQLLCNMRDDPIIAKTGLSKSGKSLERKQSIYS